MMMMMISDTVVNVRSGSVERKKKSANAYGNAVALDTSCDVLGEQDQ